MTKINTVANNGLTIVENYNKLLEQFRKTKTIDDVRILVASAKDFISVYPRKRCNGSRSCPPGERWKRL